MKKDVLIHVRGLQMMDPEEEQEPIEIVVPGQYYYRNGSHYLRYEEMMDDTAQPTVNYIKMSSQGVEVRKQGQVNVHMVFEQGKKNMTFYSTPFGTLQMGIAATGLELQEEEDNIHLKAPYQIPYRCLVPVNRNGLLVAGRCISGTYETNGSYRVTGDCMATGQAAGAAAALAVQQNVRVRDVDIHKLRGIVGME